MDAIYGADGAFPDIIWDGIINPEKPEELAVICVRTAKPLLDIDTANGFANPRVDMQSHSRDVEKLEPISLVPNKHWTFGLLLGLVCACSGDRPVTLHAPDEPERLSAWGVISADASGKVPDLATFIAQYRTVPTTL